MVVSESPSGQWTSRIVQSIVSPYLSYEEAQQKGYTTMPFEDFCVARTMEGLDKGTRDLVSCLGTNHVYDSMAAWTRL
ncbi:MAG: hypothetical protein V1725_01755, partial [archaeon]